MVAPLSLACACSVAQAQSLLPLECVGDLYPPYTIEKAGVVSGLGPQLLQAAGKLGGLDITVQILPHARIELELQRGAASLVLCALAFSHTPGREEFMRFTQLPLYTTRYTLYAKSPRRLTPYSHIDALKGARLGVRLGFRLPETLGIAVKQKTIALDTAANDELNFRKLALGRVDYVLTAEEVGASILRTMGNPDIQAMKPPLAELPVYVVFNRARPEAESMETALSKGLAALRGSANEQRIRLQYAQ